MAFAVEKGTLYVVPTPIGNLSDMTERALAVLKDVDFVAAEDTRVSGKLLSLFEIHVDFVSYHEHNKASQGEKIVERLKGGQSGAIVTDAGTPAISDPGEDLVAKCRENGVNVVPLPGACAFVTALSASGFSSRRFCFEGFLPTDKKERAEVLDDYKNNPRTCFTINELSKHKESMEYYKNEKKTVIFYEAPHRVAETAGILLEALGDRRVCAARELTKLNEEFFIGSLSELCKGFETKEPRGEYVLIVEGATETEEAFFAEMTVEQHVAFYESQGLSRMDAIKACAKDRGVSKNTVYKQLISS